MNTSPPPSHLHVVSNWLANASPPLGPKAENHEGEPLGPLLTWKSTNEDVILLERFLDLLKINHGLPDLDEAGSICSGSAVFSELPLPSSPRVSDDGCEESLVCTAAESDNDGMRGVKPGARDVQRDDNSRARTSQQRQEEEHERNGQQEESDRNRAGQEGDEEDDYSNPSGTSIVKVSHGGATWLACPFYTRNPAKWRDCRTKGSRTMHAIMYEGNHVPPLTIFSDEGSK
jgi:hypothetical protein